MKWNYSSIIIWIIISIIIIKLINKANEKIFIYYFKIINKYYKINKNFIKSIIYKILYILTIIILWYILYIIIIYNNNNIEYQYRKILKNNIINIPLNIGIDGISLPLIILTSIIIPIIIYIREIYNKEDYKYIIKLIIIEIILISIFLLLDIFSFYILFEIILIPLFIIIIKYGSNYNRFEAAYKIYIYTFIGSIIFLISIIIIIIMFGTTWNELLEIGFLIKEKEISKINIIKIILWIIFYISFSIKIPIFPFHSWLPEAHTEAPTSGSILLAAILLKVGIFAFFRFSLSFFNSLNIYFSPIIFLLSIISIIYSNFIILRLIDLKKIIAFSSIIHMNFIILGIFSFDFNSLIGSYYTLISHAFISSALFLLIGFLYHRYFTRNLLYYKGLSSILPILSIFLFIFIISNISFPLTSAFPGEFLILLGIIKNSLYSSILVILSLIIYTSLNILILNKLLFGNISIYIYKFKDLNFYEFISILPFLLFNLIFGLYCTPLINIPYLALAKYI